jgi:hypothetical protein
MIRKLSADLLFRCLAAVSGLSCLLLVLFIVQTALWIPLWETHPLPSKKMMPRASSADDASVRVSINAANAVRLLEDGREIGQAVGLVDEVKELGQGRHKLKPGIFYFSSSDGTDPRQNNRDYALRHAWEVPAWGISAAWLSAVGALLLALWVDRHRVQPWGKKLRDWLGDRD